MKAIDIIEDLDSTIANLKDLAAACLPDSAGDAYGILTQVLNIQASRNALAEHLEQSALEDLPINGTAKVANPATH